MNLATTATCNPLDLAYRFQRDVACRAAADPSIVWYRDRFWLFPTQSAGYWHSVDLHHWTLVASSALPIEALAPDAAVIDDAVVVMATADFGGPSQIFRSTDPLADQWQLLCELPGHSDPALFQDDDGRVYRYWGCSADLPLFACELDRHSLLPIGERVEIPVSDMQRLGWQRRGEGHCLDDKKPFVEGPWMTKHGGRYYLEYSAPGTQFDVYSDAVLVGDAPLGPFTLQAHNPTSYHPAAFMPGAGHGSTFQDPHGNWWHAATMRISVRHIFERRIGIWPAGFDADGVYFCNTAYGDWPRRMPTGPWDPIRDAVPPWMLLSRGAAVQASSQLPEHPAEHAVDEDAQTWWAAAVDTPAELTLDLGVSCRVHALQLNLAEEQATQHGRSDDLRVNWQLFGANGSGDEHTWQLLVDHGEQHGDHPHQFVELSTPATARFLRLRLLHMPSGLPAVSGLRVFGHAPGEAPSAVENLQVRRDATDPRNARLEWQAVAQARGYLVRWGVAPDKLYASQLVHDDSHLHLRCLNSELDYFFRVEAWNCSGIGPASAVAGGCASSDSSCRR